MRQTKLLRFPDTDRIWWIAIALLAVGAMAAYVVVSHHAVPGPAAPSAAGFEPEPEVDDDLRTTVEVVRRVESAKSPSADGAVPEQREMIARALADAVRAARTSSAAPPSTSDGTNDEVVLEADGTMPLVEMSWEQYRSWTKYANALAQRDYTATLELLSNVREQFDQQIAGAMEDAFVEDYQAYLDDVIEKRCDGHEPESVWRKTLFMQFVLAKLDRSSETIEQRALDARRHCGYQG